MPVTLFADGSQINICPGPAPYQYLDSFKGPQTQTKTNYLPTLTQPQQVPLLANDPTIQPVSPAAQTWQQNPSFHLCTCQFSNSSSFHLLSSVLTILSMMGVAEFQPSPCQTLQLSITVFCLQFCASPYLSCCLSITTRVIYFSKLLTWSYYSLE